MSDWPFRVEDGYGNELTYNTTACEDHEVRLVINAGDPLYLNRKGARDLIVHLLEHDGLFG